VQLDGKDIPGIMRATFSTSHGLMALTWILEDCGTFAPIPATAEAIAVRNWSIKLLNILGGGGMAEENIRAFAKTLMKQTIEKREDTE